MIANLTSGTTNQTKEVVDSGVIPTLVELLKSSNVEAQVNVIWALGNIAAHRTHRDSILQTGVLKYFLRIFEDAVSGKDDYFIRKATWALRNLCGGCGVGPLPAFDEIKDAIRVFAKIIITQEKTSVLEDALGSLWKILQEIKDENKIQLVLKTGVVPRIVELLK